MGCDEVEREWESELPRILLVAELLYSKCPTRIQELIRTWNQDKLDNETTGMNVDMGTGRSPTNLHDEDGKERLEDRDIS